MPCRWNSSRVWTGDAVFKRPLRPRGGRSRSGAAGPPGASASRCRGRGRRDLGIREPRSDVASVQRTDLAASTAAAAEKRLVRSAVSPKASPAPASNSRSRRRSGSSTAPRRSSPRGRPGETPRTRPGAEPDPERLAGTEPFVAAGEVHVAPRVPDRRLDVPQRLGPVDGDEPESPGDTGAPRGVPQAGGGPPRSHVAQEQPFAVRLARNAYASSAPSPSRVRPARRRRPSPARQTVSRRTRSPSARRIAR